MIEKIEILQQGKGRDLCCHPCEESFRLLCIVAYHHELAFELRKDRFDSLSKTLVGPCMCRPVLLVQSVRDIEGNVGHFKQIQLYRCVQVSLIPEDRKVVVLPLNILKILQVMHIGCDHVIGMNDSVETAQGMNLNP